MSPRCFDQLAKPHIVTRRCFHILNAAMALQGNMPQLWHHSNKCWHDADPDQPSPMSAPANRHPNNEQRKMWIVAIAWIYVALMMALAEATSTQGSVLGAVITFVFYGVAPTALVMYVLRTPDRRRARRQAEAQAAAASAQPDASGQAAGAPVAAEGKEPGGV